jgi:hypothetical protein
MSMSDDEGAARHDTVRDRGARVAREVVDRRFDGIAVPERVHVPHEQVGLE